MTRPTDPCVQKAARGHDRAFQALQQIRQKHHHIFISTERAILSTSRISVARVQSQRRSSWCPQQIFLPTINQDVERTTKCRCQQQEYQHIQEQPGQSLERSRREVRPLTEERLGAQVAQNLYS